jgi:uncharacterized membrane protein
MKNICLASIYELNSRSDYFISSNASMRNYIKALLWTQVLAICLLAMMLYPQLGILWQIIRWICASIFILFVPGYWLSYIFFVIDEISSFERFLMSIASSFALVTFASFYLHYFAIALYPIHIYVLSICIIATFVLLVWYIDKRRMVMNDE